MADFRLFDPVADAAGSTGIAGNTGTQGLQGSTGIATGGGGSTGFVVSFGGAAAASTPFRVNGDITTAGVASDLSTRSVIPVACTISSIGWSCDGVDTINIRRNGGLVQGFAVSATQGTFSTTAQAFAVGDYVELQATAGRTGVFNVYFTT